MLTAETLTAALLRPLPGARSHRAFAPELAYGRHEGPPSRSARQAAVLVLLIRQAGGWELLLTVRPTAMGTHAGQVCFPGGAMDAGETPEQTAEREFQEEVGGDVKRLKQVGRLSPVFVFNSNFAVTPCVAIADGPLEFNPSPAEVAAILSVPLTHLADRSQRSELTISRRGLVFTAPCYPFEQRQIWGATALMIAELLEITGL